MKVNIGGQQVLIDFQHAHFSPAPLNGVLVKGSTTAIANLGVDPVNGAERVESAVAWCSAKDSFDKVKGRKVALTRLLAAMKLPKEARREVWNVYNRR